ncbi:MAG: hypothetical protein ABI988_17430, partial [Nitrospirota bacterium]
MSRLPIEDVLPALCRTLAEGQNVLLTAAPVWLVSAPVGFLPVAGGAQWRVCWTAAAFPAAALHLLLLRR